MYGNGDILADAAIRESKALDKPCMMFDSNVLFLLLSKHPVKAAGLLFYWLLGWRGCGGWFCLIILKAGRGRSRLPHLCLDEPLHG